MKRRLSTLVLGLQKSGSFVSEFENGSTIGSHGYDIPTSQGQRAPMGISYSVRLRVARSTPMGTCQSLCKRDG
ncbi:MAG: hypothetical protein K1V84_11875 [Muribaculaceae bacterium]